MSAHPLTHRYLEKVAGKANLPVLSLKPEDTWEALGVSDDHTMSRLAGALQNVAADYNPEAHITPGELSGGKDVAGGLIVTWEAAALGTLTRDEAIAQIQEAQSELHPVQEVVVTAKRKSTRKKAKKKSPRRKTAKKKSPKKKSPKKKSKTSRRRRSKKRSAKRK